MKLERYRCFLIRVMALNPQPLLLRSSFEVDTLTSVSVSKQWLLERVKASVSSSTMKEALQACEAYNFALAKLQVRYLDGYIA